MLSMRAALFAHAQRSRRCSIPARAVAEESEIRTERVERVRLLGLAPDLPSDRIACSQCSKDSASARATSGSARVQQARVRARDAAARRQQVDRRAGVHARLPPCRRRRRRGSGRGARGAARPGTDRCPHPPLDRRLHQPRSPRRRRKDERPPRPARKGHARPCLLAPRRFRRGPTVRARAGSGGSPRRTRRSARPRSPARTAAASASGNRCAPSQWR